MTIQAKEKSEIMLLHERDAIVWFPRSIQLSPLTIMASTKENVYEKYLNDKQERRWQVMKEKTMDSLLREQSGNPNMTRKQWLKNAKLSQ
jgi:hypothetical protein